MLLKHRIAHLDRSVDWFVALSVSTSRALEELAHAASIPTAQVKVGFKNMGNLAMWLEERADPSTPYVMPSGAASCWDRSLALCSCARNPAARL
jgi:hypothetical protein